MTNQITATFTPMDIVSLILLVANLNPDNFTSAKTKALIYRCKSLDVDEYNLKLIIEGGDVHLS